VIELSVTEFGRGEIPPHKARVFLYNTPPRIPAGTSRRANEIMKSWWHLDVDAAALALETDLASGLAESEAAARLAKFGPNVLREKRGRGPWGILFDQFKDFIVWVLAAAALVSGLLLKEWIDAAAIIAILILNAVLGFVQEYRAEKSLAALKSMAAPFSKVLRGGARQSVPAAELVPGDLVEIEAGDNVPADVRIVWATPNFAVQEASLTGESTPVAKTCLELEERDVPLAERGNMAYLGTSVVAGKARALVAETGMQTELGRIAGMIQSIGPEETPLQKRLKEFGRWVVYLCFGLVALVFGVELLRGGRLLDIFMTSVSLAVAAIPEGLPAVVTIALALGVQRMIRRHVLIRKLPSVETLGCATVICSDKTGTLTRNEMTVREVVTLSGTYLVEGAGYEPRGTISSAGAAVRVDDHPELGACLAAAVLCNGAELTERDGGWRIVGDPTEGALLTAAAKAGLFKSDLEASHVFAEEIPFDSERKMMTVVRKDAARGRLIAYVKGAPDLLLAHCARVRVGRADRAMTPEDAARLLEANARLSDKALRVLAVAERAFDQEPDRYHAALIETDLTFLGLVAMIDPPREEVKAAIAKCRASGIRTVMITGDHKNTAVAIARELGFYGEDSRALTGEELDRLDDADFEGAVEKVAVYARVAPEHKLRAVRAWRKRRAVVAMTGDGVNDAPAVKEADIGVAMGITGTDVTKEVSDMVITDDNFASIVAAVEEGRGIYDNIKKFIHYLLSCNSGEILVMFVAALAGWPVPLLPIQILWVNIVTDGLPALALGMDPVDPNIMARPPRPPDEPVITPGRAGLILAQGALIAFCALAAFLFVHFVENKGIITDANLGRARTAALFALAAGQLFHALNCRSQKESLFKLGFFGNRKLIAACGISLLIQGAINYIPFTQRIFRLEPLNLLDMAVIVALSSLPLWVMELAKLVDRKRRFLPAA
jgi:P-type Ca2+ transporter type 2C